MKVPWLSKVSISESADQLMTDYSEMIGEQLQPPIPVEDMISRHLDLGLRTVEYDAVAGMEDVLGATYVPKRLICINKKLTNDANKGRLYFTLAHEVGHWILHRPLLKAAKRLAKDTPQILCRSSDAKAPIEWQADYFAACLLMPELAVREAFHRAFGMERIEIFNTEGCSGPLYYDPCCATNWHYIAGDVIRVGGFTNTSKHSMMIRLKDLGLIENQTRQAMGWQ